MKRVAFVIDSFDWLGGLNYYRSIITAVVGLYSPYIEIVVLVPSTTSDANAAYFDGAQMIRSKWLDKTGKLAIVRRLLRKGLFGWDVVLGLLLRRHRIDVLSHYAGKVPRFRHLRRIGWIPDFQYVHLPRYFSEDDLKSRARATSLVLAHSDAVIVSSHDAERDLRSIDAGAGVAARVLHFVPCLQRLNQVPESAQIITRRYSIPTDYIFLPNQFWVHKNHRVAIEAVARARRTGMEITIVASGSADDHRAPQHFADLREMIERLGVGDLFRIVGVIPYLDLVALMTHARAVLNPSYFEGWSTTVEEAKALGKTVILSDIPVHREQNPDGALYFDPNDPAMLESVLTAVMGRRGGAAPQARDAEREHQAARNAFGARYQQIVLDVAALRKGERL